MNDKDESVRFQDLYEIISDTLSIEGTVTFTANGSSMLPMIRGGLDRVTIEPLPAIIRKNDVIFYRRQNGAFVLHRVVSVKRDAYVFCGDHQFSLEKGVTRDRMIGILTGIDRYGKRIDLTSPSVRIYCFFLPCRRFMLRLRHCIAVVLKRTILKSNVLH